LRLWFGLDSCLRACDPVILRDLRKITTWAAIPTFFGKSCL
jgi:hypothetical protein